jgi:hypothetical protein
LSKKAELLKDPDVSRWYTNVARGSSLTADVNLRRLSLFCEQNGLTPKELIALGTKSKKGLEDLIQDHITRMESENKSPGYIEGVVKGVKSWLIHNDIELKRKIRISNRGATPTIENERVPEKEELKALLMYGDERTSAIICLVAQSGLRLEVLGNASGDDGLTIGDFPELKVQEGQIEFTRIPMMVVVRPSLSKVNHKYFTFLPKEGCDYLAAYLNRRIADGEEITPTTPVIATKTGFRKGEETESQFMTTRNVSKIIRKTMRPRFTWRPYVLRSYFDTQMLLAESHGKVAHPYRVFFMGHKGDMEARYSTNKGRLPENLIEDMRNAFSVSAEYLETTPRPERDKKEMLLEMWRQQAKMYGIDPMKVKIEKERELGKELSLDEEQELLTTQIKKLTMPQLNNNSKPYQSKIIGEKELVLYVEDGWEIVRELSNGKFLVKKPNHTG